MANTAISDWIGQLPPGVVGEILARLPIRDAVRTSILSRAWRYRWNSMPDLDFTNIFIDRLCSSADGFGRIVNRCLLVREAPIRKFSVNSNLHLGPEIGPWIYFLSRHGIQELQLSFGGFRACRFPSCLFNCKNLTVLKLDNCKLDIPPTFEGFVNLKTLDLTSVDCSNIERLISRSPSLERLTLISLIGPDLVIRISAPKIKYLILESGFQDIFYLEDLPELVHIECMEVFPSNRSDSTLIEVFRGAPNLEYLKVELVPHFYQCFKLGYDPGTSATAFNHLKFMELLFLDLMNVDQVLGVLELLLNAPNLEEIVILSEYSSVLSFPIKLVQVYSECPLKRGGFMKLKVIEMEIVCEPAEVEFAKFLLCNSPVLEEMKVSCDENLPKPKKAKATRMFNKLLKLPRASAQAAITFYHGGKKL